MKSIEERAKWYGYIVKERGDMPCELGESTYIEVATEQRKIDIDNAHKAFVELLRVQYCEDCDESMHQYIDDALKKYLEE